MSPNIVYVINIIMFECFVHRLSECYFANKGSAALLCSPKLHHQQQHQQQPRRKRHHHHSHPHRHQSLSAPASSRLSASEDEMQSRANDIQAHLQSMFHILRPDDSLNMVCIILYYIFFKNLERQVYIIQNNFTYYTQLPVLCFYLIRQRIIHKTFNLFVLIIIIYV